MKLQLGCGVVLRPGFVNVDILEPKQVRGKAKYVQADVRKLPFKNNSAELVEMFSLLEHFSFREVVNVLKEVRRVMKKGGKLIIVTDDFDGMAHDWFEMRKGPFNLERYLEVMETIYGNQHHDGEFHKTAMTPDFLNWALVTAGFKKGDLRIYKKGTLVPRIGSKPANKKAIFRNDQLVAEIIK